MRALLIATFVTGLLAPTAAFAADCSVVPPAPKFPVGCRGMEPTCICDTAGNCHWEYLCTRE